MSKKPPKRPKDANRLAKSIVDIATGSAADDASVQGSRAKDQAAVSLGRRGGLKGGRARAERLTGEQRRAIASKAAATRWSKEEDDG